MSHGATNVQKSQLSFVCFRIVSVYMISAIVFVLLVFSISVVGCLILGLCEPRANHCLPCLRFVDIVLPRGSKVVPFWGSYIDSYKVIPKTNYYGVYG